jgi:hypothetical protein
MALRTTFSLDRVTRGSRGFTVVASRTRHKRNHPEQDLQAQLVEALQSILLPGTVFFHVPNGGERSKVEAAILNGQGVLAGVPDLIFIRDGRAFGLELKSESGSLSPEQRATFPLLRAAGMRIEVARSLDEAFEHLRDAGIPLRLKEHDLEFGRRKRAAFEMARQRAA